MEILSAQQMRRVDRRAIDELALPALELMEAAGRGVAETLLLHHPDLAARGVLVLCGKGHNGGDGLVAARHLARRGLAPRVSLLARRDELAADTATQVERAEQAGVEIREVPDLAAWSAARAELERQPLVVDALLGTGVRGGARGLLAAAIEDLNRSACPVVSIDLPSGLDGDTHRVEGPAVHACRTYTLCRPKLALVIEPASHHAGEWCVIPIGIPDASVRAERSSFEWIDRAAARAWLADRPADAHKGTWGHLLVVAGSRGKSGAAVLVARGALRAGVGLVTVAAPASCQERIAVQQAEIMTEGLPETADGFVSGGAAPAALAHARGRDALAIGPGLGSSADTRALVTALLAGRTVPAVLDADGLNAVAGAEPPLRAGELPLVLTPHPGEAARLLGCAAAEVQADRVAAAVELAQRTGAVVVLKGHRTLVATPDGLVSVNSTGNPGMATAGTGDVLTGVVGAFLARGLSARDAARLAVFVHGAAGDGAATRLGQDGMIASDLVDELPASLAELLAEPEPGAW